jgi:non-specific serine/threonine protein kinase
VSEAESKPVRIGRFQIIRPLGRGATATVYLAHDPRHERQIALKVIKFGGDLEEGEARVKQHRRLRKLFQTEGAVAARLDHPNIVKYLNWFIDNKLNELFIAVEWAEKGDLKLVIKKAIEEDVSFPEKKVWEYIH